MGMLCSESFCFQRPIWKLSPPSRMLPAPRTLLDGAAYTVLLCSVPRMYIYLYLPVILWMCWSSSILPWLCFLLVIPPLLTPLRQKYLLLSSFSLGPFIIFPTFPSFMCFLHCLTPSGSDPETVTVSLTVRLQKIESTPAHLINGDLLAG